MDLLGHAEDQHAEHRRRPKLAVTGHLEGTFGGRPVALEAKLHELSISVPNLRSAWGLRRGISASTLPLLRFASDAGLSLSVRIGSHRAFSVFPNPHIAVRLVAPSLRFSD